MRSPHSQRCAGALSGTAANLKASSRIKTRNNYLQKGSETRVLLQSVASLLASVPISPPNLLPGSCRCTSFTTKRWRRRRRTKLLP